LVYFDSMREEELMPQKNCFILPAAAG